eukprot:gnl/MRDRNA2_/MRDRNA2_16638_c0_seq2.p1 gnl/MRDRNA2_/MRDRNA2_16638_c0~~gnl/MRDRNA2_/MRDRNA2_16638_c0_seq2.p1  ORF type:complete len:129 (+),score=9.23 gnl/MRDRNA2_/MRDRNA2_16638_c0_seq2:48-389(+)
MAAMGDVCKAEPVLITNSFDSRTFACSLIPVVSMLSPAGNPCFLATRDVLLGPTLAPEVLPEIVQHPVAVEKPLGRLEAQQTTSCSRQIQLSPNRLCGHLDLQAVAPFGAMPC